MNGCLTVARESLRRVAAARAILLFAALFAVLALGLSYFGLAGQRAAGFQGFARLTGSLLNLVVYVVPLMALMVGTTEVAGRLHHLSVILAQPVGRSAVLVGSYLGVAAALAAALVIGLGAAGVLVGLQSGAGAAAAGGFIVLVVTALALLLAFLAVAYLLGVVFLDRLRAMGAAVVVWFAAVVGYDLAVIGLSSLLKGVPLKSVLLPAILLNPVDLGRVVVTLAGGRGALFGPAGATLVDVFGRPAGAVLAAGVLALHVALPLVVAVLVFRRRDL
ncbi:MAG: ABC transporter permease subunit [Candidatus Krumholzibacteriia bacterium]